MGYTLDPEIKQYLSSHTQDIIHKNYDKLIEDIDVKLREPLVEVLELAHIDYMPYITNIVEWMYRDSDNIPKNFILPDNIEAIFQGAFIYSNVENIIIPKNCSYIDTRAFYACNELKSVDIQSTVIKFIGKACFVGCHNLEYVNIPDNLSTILNNAFCDCINLKISKLPSGLQYLGDSSFYGCKSIKEIFIPKSVDYFGYLAFGNCPSLTKVTYEGKEHNLARLKVMFDDPEEIEFTCLGK